MNSKHLLAAGLIAFASASTFAAGLGNEFTEAPQAQSTLTRAQVQAETRAALAQGSLERSSYDEQIAVVTDRQQAQGTTSRAEVRAETRTYYKSHPNAQFQRNTYGFGA